MTNSKDFFKYYTTLILVILFTSSCNAQRVPKEISEIESKLKSIDFKRKDECQEAQKLIKSVKPEDFTDLIAWSEVLTLECNGEQARALNQLKSIFEKSPSIFIGEQLVYRLLRTAENQSTVKVLSWLIKENPNSSSYYSELARLGLRTGRNDFAVMVLEKGIYNSENPESLYFDMANSLFFTGKYEESLDYLRKIKAEALPIEVDVLRLKNYIHLNKLENVKTSISDIISKKGCNYLLDIELIDYYIDNEFPNSLLVTYQILKDSCPERLDTDLMLLLSNTLAFADDKESLINVYSEINASMYSVEISRLMEISLLCDLKKYETALTQVIGFQKDYPENESVLVIKTMLLIILEDKDEFCKIVSSPDFDFNAFTEQYFSLDDTEDNILKVDWVVSNYQVDFSLVIDNIKLKKLVDYCTN